MNQRQFNQTLLQVRRTALLAGAQPSLRWWSGDILQADVLRTLFPATGAEAGFLLLEQTVRRIGSEERGEGRTLFDFTEEHEVVLRQEVAPPQPPAPLPTFTSGRELAQWLRQRFPLPSSADGRWALSSVNRHATLPDPLGADRSSEANFARLGLLVNALAHSDTGQYLQPVLISPPGRGV